MQTQIDELKQGALVKYREIIDKGDETARFLIAEDYGDGRVKVKELTQLTAFGFATYTRQKTDFVAVTNEREIAQLCKLLK